MHRSLRHLLLALLVVMTACKPRGGRDSRRSTDASAGGFNPAPSASVFALDAAADATTLADASVVTDAASDVRKMSTSTATTIIAADASASSCKLLRPPIMQPYGGPAALRFLNAGGQAWMAELVFNESSRPRFSSTPFSQKRSLLDVPMPPKTTLPACAALSNFVYCPDVSGAIHRTEGGGEKDTVVAQSRPGTPLAVTKLGDRVLLAYIRNEVTSEGVVRAAELKLDDGAPLRLSDEGSGATYVELVTRGDGALALTLDGRRAMTPAHVRVVKVVDGKLSLSRDAVVFVGGAAETYTRGRLALSAEGAAYVVIASAHAVEGFGMAVVRLSDPPTEDEPVVWSMYPNGIDPAPIAVTHGVSPIRVARVRPSAPERGASLLLEVGQLSTTGEFLPKCVLSDALYIKDVELDVDREGTMWLFWRDPRGSHLERRALP